MFPKARKNDFREWEKYKLKWNFWATSDKLNPWGISRRTSTGEEEKGTVWSIIDPEII